MTREEAIRLIGWLKCTTNREDDLEAIDMAIEALQEPKTIIGIDIPYGSDKGIATLFKGKDEKMILEEVKELMSVVRCKDCDNFDYAFNYCNFLEAGVEGEDFFYAYGERREP